VAGLAVSMLISSEIWRARQTRVDWKLALSFERYSKAKEQCLGSASRTGLCRYSFSRVAENMLGGDPRAMRRDTPIVTQKRRSKYSQYTEYQSKSKTR